MKVMAFTAMEKAVNITFIRKNSNRDLIEVTIPLVKSAVTTFQVHGLTV